MRKIYSLVLIAAGLLIGTQGWAQEEIISHNPALETDVAKIGDVGFPTIKDAFAYPENGVATTIVLQKDVDYAYTTNCYCTLGKNKVVTLDLNGHHIMGTANFSGSGQSLFDIKGKFILKDSQFDAEFAKNGEELKNKYKDDGGNIQIPGYLGFSQTPNTGTDGNVIRDLGGDVTIQSGALLLLTDPKTANDGAGASYCVDVNSNDGAAYLTVDGGYFVGPRECFRTFANSATVPAVIVINNAICYGMNGIFFIQDPSGNRSGQNEVTVVNGNFYSDTNPMIRVYTTGDKNLGQTHISIEGGTCNKDALMISHTYGEKYNGTVEELLTNLQSNYPNVFNNIIGGTFASENFDIKVYQVKDSEGNMTDGTEKIYPSTLPTILSQGYYDKNNETGTITIVPITNHNITSTTDWDKMSSEEGQKATLGVSVDVTDTKEVAALEIKNEVVLTVKDGAKLIVGDGGILVDEGGKIVVEAGGILQVGAKGLDNTNANELVVYSNLSKSGVISLSPKALVRQDTKLTVELASNARSKNSIGWWQYIGIPTTDFPNWQNLDGKTTWAYDWDADNQTWHQITSKQNINTPFKGYILTSNATASGSRYEFTGQMNNKEDHTFELKAGWNLLANSYMAPIDLASFFAAMAESDGVEKTVSIYDSNTASYKYVSANALMIDDAEFTSMAPMQGFFIQTTQDGSFKFDYAACVWGQEGTDPLRAPSRQSEFDINVVKINVNGSTFGDQFVMYEGNNLTSEFDNGWDASKFMNEHINLYTSIEDKALATLATNDLNGTQLSFQAGNDVEYTMTFSNRNNDNFVLVDNLTNAQVAMTDGATYTFVATPNETVENRFEIRKAGGVVTNLAEMKAAHAVKGIYTAAGQYVGKADRWNTLPAGMYIVDGVRMAK